MNRILILSPGRQVYLIKLFKRFFNVFVGDNNPLSLKTYSDLETIKLPRYTTEEYKETLLEYIKEKNIEYVITLSDIEAVIISSISNGINKLGCKIIGADREKAEVCLDKYLFYKYLISNNIFTPRSYIHIEDILQDIREGGLQYPIIAKNRWGMGSKGLMLIHNEGELLQYNRRNNQNFVPTFIQYNNDESNSIIYQEAIHGQEYGIDIVNDLNNNFFDCRIKKKVEMRGGETDIAQIVEDKDILDLAKQLSLIFAHSGNIDCDIIRDINGKLYVIDINPRFGGGYIFSLESGLNVPYLLSEWINGKQPEFPQKINLGITYRKITSLYKIKD